MPAVESLKHLTEFLLMLGAFVNPIPDPRQMLPVEDKTKALLLFAQKGDSSEYRQVLAAIRQKKEQADDSLARFLKGIKQIEDDIRNDISLLQKAGDKAPSITRRIESKKQTVKIRKAGMALKRQSILGRVKEEKAFTEVYRLLEKERKRGDKQPTLLVQFLKQFTALAGPYEHTLCPHPIPIGEKAKALLLVAQKGDASEHKKVLALIAKKRKETEALLAKHKGFVKELEDAIRADQAQLARVKGDTSDIEKRIAGNKRGLQFQGRCLAEFRANIEARNKEEQAWQEALRLIEQARKAVKKP
jgi:hypothetical protein